MSRFLIIDKEDPLNGVSVSSRGFSTDLYTPVARIVGEDALHDNGIPICQEVQGWGELACIGETWENDRILVELLEH